MEEKIIQAVKENKLIAIVRGVESEKCVKIAQALYDGGFRLMEITYDQKNPQSWEETAQAIGAVAKAFEGRMYVGAGTVTCTELVELILKYYDQLSEKYRKMIPLKMVYIPVPVEE